MQILEDSGNIAVGSSAFYDVRHTLELECVWSR